MIKQEVSALMDGELFDDEVSDVFASLKRDAAGHEAWLTYHLIGDVLRQPDHVHCDISVALRERLQDEPTVFAPHARVEKRARWFALSAAASVLALAVVAWLSAQVAPEVVPQVAAVQSPANVVPASMNKGGMTIDEYLMAHQEYSPSAEMQGTASYIRTVAAGR